MLQRMRPKALLLAINAASSLYSRLRPCTSTIPSVILRSYRMVPSFPKSSDSATSRSKNIAGKEDYSSTEFNDSVSVHPTALVHEEAIISEDVVIGPFCTVGSAVILGKGCVLHPNSHVLGRSELGEGCILHTGAIVGADIPGSTIVGKGNSIGHYAVVGAKCQDLKYKGGDDCHLHIGNKNDIREYVSIHRSSKASEQTTVGSGNLIMGACHIAHDCKLGNDNILANGTLLGGHVILQDHVRTGGGVAVHQRCQIDSYAFLAGGSMVVRDIPMYMMVSGDRAELCGLNLEGLRRHKFCDDENIVGSNKPIATLSLEGISVGCLDWTCKCVTAGILPPKSAYAPNETQKMINCGTAESESSSLVTTSTRADKGFSVGPLLNKTMEIIGMIEGDHGEIIKTVRMIKKAYQKLFMNTDGKLESRLTILESSEEIMSMPAVVHMLSSVRSCFEENRRGICNFGRWKCE